MDKATVIALAREAGLSHFYDSEGHCTGVTDARLCEEEKERNDDRLAEILGRFAALVEGHLKSRGYRQCAKGQKTTQFCAMLEEAVKAEREECAKVCEERKINPAAWMIDKFYNQAVEHCAAAIRSRNG